MRKLIVLALFMVACDSKPKTEERAPGATATQAAARSKVAAPAMADIPMPLGGDAPRGLKTPLPDGVVIPFKHNVVMETERTVAGVQVRTLMVEPQAPMNESIEALSRAFEGAGYTKGILKEHTVGFSKGGEGQGMMAIKSGGKHVALTFSEFEPDNPRLKLGYTGMINVAINSAAPKE